jgi:hypothetical protein
MNDDLKLLAMLLDHAHRRAPAVIGQVEEHFGGDALGARAALAQLERAGLVYLEGSTVRLTFPGFARAVAATPLARSVAGSGDRGRALRSRAA